ncbi:MAG: cadmium-translocating P-type ATPase [Clostridia bacterium]|nr:cadmium-translocating P-type ATPase [Clostridia bacterium]
MTRKQKIMLWRIIAAVSLILLLIPLKPENRWMALGLYLIPYLIAGYDILRKAVKGVINRQPTDECFLMAVATIGAFALGEYLEGAAVMIFYQIGELFQSYAVGKSRRSIAELMDIRPDSARIRQEDGSLETVDPDEVEIGSVIVVQPGEKIPIDGTVIEGEARLDTAALTGESVPRSARPGDEVQSGCVNIDGLLTIRTTHEFGESTASRILELVENASSRKSRSEAFITRFARVYTPAVCLSALALAVLPPVVSLLLGKAANWSDWIYRALTFLVISCPCALVISIPLSFFAGLGIASRHGVLIKGANYLEALASTDTVVFDKTGTMTRGVFEVSGVHHSPLDDQSLLRLAALAESRSNHPIAVSIRAACTDMEKAGTLADVHELSGLGLRAELSDGRLLLVGSEKLMRQENVDFIPCSHSGTVVHIAANGQYQGHILISDQLKPGAVEAVHSLRQLGVSRTVMLTGDRESGAKEAAELLGVDELHSELLPDGKVAEVERLLADARGKLVFLGDGINDAPVLSRADVGIAMGGLGSDAAIEAADIALMDDDPRTLATAIRISRLCMRVVRENIAFSIGVKLICLLLGALGIANMWLAIFADVGVMVLAVLNAVRILLYREKKKGEA